MAAKVDWGGVRCKIGNSIEAEVTYYKTDSTLLNVPISIESYKKLTDKKFLSSNIANVLEIIL